MSSEIIAFQFIPSFLPNVFLYIKQWRVKGRLNNTDTNLTAPQMFERLRGHHFPSEFPATEKAKTPKTLCCLLFERYSQRKSISMWKL